MKKVEIFENNNPLLKIAIDATLEHSGDFSKCKHCIESENQSTKKTVCNRYRYFFANFNMNYD